jgi:putative tricarboxylic transport membrane protein
VAPEVANNAVCGATLIPLPAFGIPGDVVTAVMLGAFVAQGLRPGPVLFQQHYDVLYALYVTLFIGTLALVIITMATARLWAKVLQVPIRITYPAILVLCVVGTYANNNSVSDVVFMLAFGVLGLGMRLMRFPVAPMVLAFVLAPMFEQSLQQSLVMVGGNPIGMVHRPIAATVMTVTAIAVAVLVWRRLGGWPPWQARK